MELRLVGINPIQTQVTNTKGQEKLVPTCYKLLNEYEWYWPTYIKGLKTQLVFQEFGFGSFFKIST